MDYRALKTECAKRSLGGAGKKEELINKLVADDNDMEQPVIETRVKVKQPKLRPTDPDPDHPGYPNWDMAGRWIRRPTGFTSWEDEFKKREA